MLQPVAVANNPNRQPFNGEALLTKVNDNWFKLAIFWQQFDFIALFFQALNGNFVINMCDNVCIIKAGKMTGMLGKDELDQERIMQFAAGGEE